MTRPPFGDERTIKAWRELPYPLQPIRDLLAAIDRRDACIADLLTAEQARNTGVCGHLAPAVGVRTGPAWQHSCALPAGHAGEHESECAYDIDTAQAVPSIRWTNTHGDQPGPFPAAQPGRHAPEPT